MSKTPWERLYHTKRWERRARHQMRVEPLCAMCLEQGITTAAVAADHVVPHKGDTYQFYCGELQSLCLQCHHIKTQVEHRGFATDIGADGWPLDRGHPVYRSGGSRG